MVPIPVITGKRVRMKRLNGDEEMHFLLDGTKAKTRLGKKKGRTLHYEQISL